MSEHHPSGYLKHSRKPIANRDPQLRIKDFEHIYEKQWDERHLRQQGERCMDCGVPTCMSGCPLGNIIPDWNDFVHRGLWRQALQHLHATNNFPEFTGYTCPAPCESSCVLAYNDNAVAIKSIERAIIDKGWEHGWIVPQPPLNRTGYSVAIVGSGPAGLAAAQQLNRAGHNVTVYEKSDAIGGLMQYGIPDFKFAKYQVSRRVNQLQQEGIHFLTNTEIGKDISLEDLKKQFDAVCLTIGSQQARDVDVPGRQLTGVVMAMDYLTAENQRQAGKQPECSAHAADKHVVVLGGGDTGADCTATAHRQGAKSVTQFSIRKKAPEQRGQNNPWPQPARVYKKTYAIEEGGTESFNMNTVSFYDESGDGCVDAICMERVEWQYDDQGRRQEKTVVDSNICLPADLVIIAAGFQGAQLNGLQVSGLMTTARGTLNVDENMMTNVPGVFAGGDSVMGPSIVVWAIAEGRELARHVDKYLVGESHLPSSIKTHNEQIHR